MIRRRERAIQPFASRSRRTIVGILATIALVSAGTVALSIRATSGSKHQAAIVEVAARQRTLTERYLNDVLLVRAGDQASPRYTAGLLTRSASVLLDGGTAPAVNGDDDQTELPAISDAVARRQLMQEQRLVADLTATGSAVLAGRPVSGLPLTGHERLGQVAPLQRLRVLAAVTSSVSLNASRTIASEADARVNGLITTQVLLGVAGLLISVLLALALIAATRRQNAHFRSLVTSSSDLVIVFGAGGCRYVSHEVTELTGCAEAELLGDGLMERVHPDDREAVVSAAAGQELRGVLFRLGDEVGEWRRVEARVTDLRGDRDLRGVVFNAQDITDRMRLEGELSRRAFYDVLTGLPNRGLLRDRIAQALARLRRGGGSLAVLLLDVDAFKQVNDSLGIEAGDQLLRLVAQRLEGVSRPTDTLARLGGDEFTLLVEGAGDAQARAVAERLHESLAEPVRLAGHEIQVGASIGIAVNSNPTTGPDDLIRNADVAMYAAKGSDRGGFAFYRPEMARRAGEQLGLEQDLRRALARGELGVHYQPEVALEDARVIGVEALVRWRHPKRGNVSPGEFIPVAETTGMILALGEFVLREACEQTARWRADDLLGEGFVTWVNLSPKQLAAGGVDRIVSRALADSGLEPGQLGLEVTETAIVASGPGDNAREELAALHDLGVRIAVDDFGTGFSALGQLRHFPIDVLKVDRSFVQGVESDARDAAIVANVVSLAHSLGIVAVAEGIETQGQLDALRAIGCDHAQGYLFARPAPPDAIAPLLARGNATPPPAEALPSPA